MNMGSHPKIFLFAVIALLFSISTPFSIQAAVAPFKIKWTQITTESAFGVNWSPAGNDLVSGLYETSEIIILDWQTSDIKQDISFPNQSGRMDLTFATRWSPNGHSIATFDGAGNLYVLDPEIGLLRTLQESKDEYGYHAVAWSPDSASVAALKSDGYLDIISLQTGEILQTIDVAGGENERGEGLLYFNFDWSPDGNLFAAPHLMKDIAGGQPVMGFWNRDGKIVETYTQESLSDSAPSSPCSTNAFLLDYTLGVQWANDSRTLATSGGDGYGVCRLNIDGTVDSYQISNVSKDTLRWSPDQKWLAASHSNDEACSVALSDAANTYQTTDEQVNSSPCYINALAWSPDSQHLAAATNIGLWIGTLGSP